MSRPRNQTHQSHQPAAKATLPRRTPEAIAARNRAWRSLCLVLPLPARYLDRTGKPAGGGA